jgi:hypothetical protein
VPATGVSSDAVQTLKYSEPVYCLQSQTLLSYRSPPLRQRQQDYPVIRLIGDHREICQRMDRRRKLRRPTDS